MGKLCRWVYIFTTGTTVRLWSVFFQFQPQNHFANIQNPMNSKIKKVLLLFNFVLVCTSVLSQIDAHYWTHQYGAKGLLLNGAVIASTEDETAIFYNPGALGNGEEFGVSLSFFTPSYAELKTKDYFGAGSEVRDRGIGFSPGYGAVGFKPFKDDRFRAAIASFTRFRSNVRLRSHKVGKVENQPNLLFLGDLAFQRNMSERWFGAGMAFRINENLSVGLSQFVTFHSENTGLTVRKDIVHKDNPFDLVLGWHSNFKYSFSAHGGLLTKLGLLANPGEMKLGLVATTPTFFHLRSSALYDMYDQKVFALGNIQLVSNLAEAKLKDYKTPWSFGLGLDCKVKRTRISFSSEYFLKTSLYTIIESTDDPFNGLANGGNEQTTLVRTENRAVINFAVGLQTRYSEKTTFIFGFRTDRNQRLIDQDLETLSFLSTSPGIFHFSFGGFFTFFNNNRFSLGLDYAYGRKKTRGRLVDLSDISPQNLFGFSDDGNTSSTYQAIVVICTYDFILKSWKNRKWKKKTDPLPSPD